MRGSCAHAGAASATAAAELKGSISEDLPRKACIRSNLRLQRVETGKFLLRPDEIDESDAQMAAVKIDIGVEEVCLEPRHEAANCRAQADICHAADGAAGERMVGPVTANPHGVYAERRMEIVVEPEIGSWKADRPATPITGRHPPVDFPEAAEKRCRLARLPRFQQLANMCRGIDGRIVAANRVDHGDVEAVLLTCGAQKIGVAAAPVAKGAVPADDDVRGADRPDNDFGDEVLGTLRREAEVEMLHE